MKSILELQRQLLPDLLEVMRKRYEVLRHIRLMQPVGRRSLASALAMTERVLRSEVDFLKDRGLVRIEAVGMSLTPLGADLVSDLEPIIKDLFGLTELEIRLARVLRLKKAVVVQGDSDQSDWVKKEMGRAGVRLLKQTARPGQVVAVAGGTTVAAVAEMMKASPALRESIFIPARGGLGEEVELEANYITSLMAQKAGGRYRLMHVPEQLSHEAYDTLIREPHIQEVLELVRSARIVVHGIGDATTMATRRKSSPELLRLLQEKGAVGEAFGYYFNRKGEIVYRGRSLGLSLEDLENVEMTIAVAGGAGKAEAIAAVCPVSGRDTLITDEAAARAILKQHG
ncbi:central glycolytic genes regulator [Melghirimyces profundicolus]|uniref:Central glycolytic genes regulator n=1 Tax=Melghirimyces profundicolus TaxID=1242148 RepID=A0A2T6BU51_9BACL|nr:sugar-binding domain-containing protein [Melghirimyces profundicolus]PTX59611.1 central glycolytic genes regulator [Melghirimyces profundicolus]